MVIWHTNLTCPHQFCTDTAITLRKPVVDRFQTPDRHPHAIAVKRHFTSSLSRTHIFLLINVVLRSAYFTYQLHCWGLDCWHHKSGAITAGISESMTRWTTVSRALRTRCRHRTISGKTRISLRWHYISAALYLENRVENQTSSLRPRFGRRPWLLKVIQVHNTSIFFPTASASQTQP